MYNYFRQFINKIAVDAAKCCVNVLNTSLLGDAGSEDSGFEI